MREQTGGGQKLPLSRLQVLLTRAAEQAAEFSEILAVLGATTIECPTIRLVAPYDWKPLDLAIKQIADYDWLILTSANAVRFFFQRMGSLGIKSKVLEACKVCAVGPKTADAIRAFGLEPKLIPTIYNAEGVIDEFQKLELSGVKILFPHADQARELIPCELAKMGALVDTPVAYRNVIPERLPAEAFFALETRTVDCITFTSPSTAKNMAIMLGHERFIEMLNGVAIASIGTITSKACRNLGLKVDIEAADSTLKSLAEKIAEHFIKIV